MIERIIEYQETRQFRKERQRRQSIRYLTIMLVVLGVLGIGASIVDAFTPSKTAEPAKTSEPVSAISPAQEQEYTSKQEKFCLDVAQLKGLQEPGVTKRHEACLVETDGWSIEDFE